MKYSITTFTLLLLSQAVFAGKECQGPLQIKSGSDLDSIRSCQVIEGSVTIQNITSASQDVLNLSQLQQVRGDLTIEGNGELSQVSLANLRQVNGKLAFQNNRLLSRLDLTQLTSVQSLEISVQPSLGSIQFPSGLSQIESFKVTDTIARRIVGLTANKIKDIHIANNVYLNDITLNHLQQVSGVMTISANSPNLTLDLSSMSDIYQGDFRNLAKMNGFNRVQKVTGDLSFVSNSFSSLSLPNITQVSGTLTVSNNMQLQNLSVPVLQQLGGALSLANNTQLSEVDVPKLQQVDGTVDVTGNFKKMDLSSLTDVRGGLNIQTSSSNFSCDDINQLQGGVTKGHEFTCKSNVTHPKSNIKTTQGGDDSVENKSHTLYTTTTTALFLSFLISMLYL